MNHSLLNRAEPAVADRYEQLLKLSPFLRAKPACTDLLRLLPEKLHPLIEFDYLSVFLTNSKTGEDSWYVSDPSSPLRLVLVAEPPPEETLSARVLDHQKLAVFPSNDESETLHLDGLAVIPHFASSVTLPLKSGRRRCGTLTIASSKSNAYPSAEVQFLEAVADQVATSIVLVESERWSDRVELILDVSNTLVSKLEMQELFRSITASVRKSLACDFVGLAALDPETNELRSYVVDFPEGRGFIKEGGVLPKEYSLLAEAVQSGKYVLGAIDDLPISAMTDKGRAEGLRLACVYPLISRDRTLGVLTIARRNDDAFCQDDVDLLGQVTHQVAIALDNAMAYRQISELKDRLAQENLYLENEIRSELKFDEIVGHSPSLLRVLKQVETVAPTDSTVLIYGETGTGKELIARAIHDLSSRSGRTFVKLNCAAIPTGLLESELFGHEKGAFTGAVAQRIGRFELANHGTVFLDEIGEIPLELQPKLLRVLQEREFERLGSSRTLRSDARLIAATNRDLAEMVDDQTFRADLYYRLNVFPVHLPPLRERLEDIPLLVRHFVDQFARRMNKKIETIPAETMNALTQYPWPGNIRELQNLIERAMILSNGSVLRVPLDGLKSRPVRGADSAGNRTMEEAERAHILSVLKDTKWVLSGPQGAATRLGMNRSTLRFRMGKLGIVRPGSE